MFWIFRNSLLIEGVILEHKKSIEATASMLF